MKFWDLETFELIGSTRPEVYPFCYKRCIALPFVIDVHFLVVPLGWEINVYFIIISFIQAAGVRAITFHPDGRTLFSGLDESLKVSSVTIS